MLLLKKRVADTIDVHNLKRRIPLVHHDELTTCARQPQVLCYRCDISPKGFKSWCLLFRLHEWCAERTKLTQMSHDCKEKAWKCTESGVTVFKKMPPRTAEIPGTQEAVPKAQTRIHRFSGKSLRICITTGCALYSIPAHATEAASTGHVLQCLRVHQEP